MTNDQITQTLLSLSKGQAQNALATLDYSEHMIALESVIFELASQAKKFFDERLALERAKNQKQRELLQMMLAGGPPDISKKSN